MDIKKIGVNTRNCDDSAQNTDYWRALVYPLAIELVYMNIYGGERIKNVFNPVSTGTRDKVRRDQAGYNKEV